MAEVWTWTMKDTNGATTQTWGATDVVAFYGASWDDAIEVDEWNESIHIESSAHAHSCVTYCGMENRYISTNNIDIGAGSVLLSTLATTDAALIINFEEDGGSTSTSGATFWAYDKDTGDTTDPVGVDVMGAECGTDTAWTNCVAETGSLALDDNTSAADHDFFICCSASPTSTGVKTAFGLKLQLTYTS